MLKLALRRVAALIPTLLVIVTVSFAIIRLAPGGEGINADIGNWNISD